MPYYPQHQARVGTLDNLLPQVYPREPAARQMDQIPYYSASGKLEAFVSPDALRDLKDRAQLILNRRGHVVRIVGKSFAPSVVRLVPGGNRQSYQQRVEGGRTWTLKGCA